MRVNSILPRIGIIAISFSRAKFDVEFPRQVMKFPIEVDIRAGYLDYEHMDPF